MTQYSKPRRVPITRGLTVQHAEEMLRQSELTPVASNDRFESSAVKDRVEGSVPPSGAVLEAGGEVELLPPTIDVTGIVAADVAGWLIPDVAGENANDAIADIFAAGFQVGGFQHHYDDTYAVDLVSGTYPPGGTFVPVGGAFLTVYISDGPAPPVTDKPPDLPNETLKA